MKNIPERCLACISKCDEPAEETDYNTVTIYNTVIICCKSQFVQKHGSDKGPKNVYCSTIGNKKLQVDRQGELAKELCACVGIRVEDYNNSTKTFGMEEVKLFAQVLAPQYSIILLLPTTKFLNQLPPMSVKLFFFGSTY